MPADIPPKPTINYRQSADYKLFPVTGAYGGPSATGDSLICHSYLDHVDFPSEVEMEQAADQPGAFREPQQTPRIPRIRRTLQAGIFVTPDQALVIADWLRNHALTLIQARRPPNA